MKNIFYERDNLIHITLENICGGKEVAIIDITDFEKVDRFPNKWYLNINKKTGAKYVMGFLKKKPFLLHRWIMDAPINMQVDHRNHNTLDNTRSNLRLVTAGENQQNKNGAYKNSKSGVRGVYWSKDKQKWIAQVRINYKTKKLGGFDTIEEAKIVVEKARSNLMEYAN